MVKTFGKWPNEQSHSIVISISILLLIKFWIESSVTQFSAISERSERTESWEICRDLRDHRSERSDIWKAKEFCAM